MSKEQLHTDDIFRQGIESYREMPSDAVWKGVEAALDEKKKRRIGFWWWFAGTGLAACILFAAYILMFQGDKNAYYAIKNHPKPTWPTAIKSENSTQTDKVISNHSEKNTSTESTQKQNNTYKTTNRPSPREKNTVNETHTAIAKGEPAITLTKETANTPVQIDNVQAQAIPSNAAFSMKLYEQIIATPSIEVIKPKLVKHILGLDLVGYSGAVAYQQKEIASAPIANSINDTLNNSNRRFGFYGAVALKAHYTGPKGVFAKLGIGYETQYFSGRQQFALPASLTNTPTEITEGAYSPTAFGDVLIPLSAQDFQGSSSQLLQGKLVYQNQGIFIPMELGYQYAYKRIQFGIAASAAFHMPISQQAVFYTDAGDTRTFQMSKQNPFNISLGLEPSIGYQLSPRFALFAGGTFRYQLRNAYLSDTRLSNAYILSGHLGLHYRIRFW